MAELNIAIIGAGPSGCMLARLLHLAGIKTTIFEGEHAPDFRSQGGTLDLHTDTGLKAIRQAGLYQNFLKYARFDGEAITISNKNLVNYIRLGGAKQGSSRGRPEIDRPKLRQILVESVPKDCIRWGKRLQSVGSDLTLNFADGSESGFDLIVGADGAFSKVRPLVSSAQPEYSGIGGYQCSIPNVKEREPELYSLVNRGSLFCFSDHKTIMAQQMGDGSITTGAWTLTKEKPGRRIPPEEAETEKNNLRKEYHDWHPKLVRFIDESQNDSLVYRSLYMLPVGHKWEHRSGVTLMGDAAHLMTPFAGEGVNLAFMDALILAEKIIKTDSSIRTASDNNVVDVGLVLDSNVKDFEEDMFERATKTQQLTYDMMQAEFFLEAPAVVVVRTFVIAAISDAVPSILYPFATMLVYVYFFVHGILYRG